MVSLFNRATQPPLPQAAHHYDTQGLQLLLALCHELQQAAGQAPSFLACRTAGNLLGVSHMQANRWLFLLTHTTVSSNWSKKASEAGAVQAGIGTSRASIKPRLESSSLILGPLIGNLIIDRVKVCIILKGCNA